MIKLTNVEFTSLKRDITSLSPIDFWRWNDKWDYIHITAQHIMHHRVYKRVITVEYPDKNGDAVQKQYDCNSFTANFPDCEAFNGNGGTLENMEKGRCQKDDGRFNELFASISVTAIPI